MDTKQRKTTETLKSKWISQKNLRPGIKRGSFHKDKKISPPGGCNTVSNIYPPNNRALNYINQK